MLCVQTSLCMRYSQEQFKKHYGQTVGLDFYLKRIVLPGEIFFNKISFTLQNTESLLSMNNLEICFTTA